MTSPPEDPEIKRYLDELSAVAGVGSQQQSAPSGAQTSAASQAAAASKDEPKGEDPLVKQDPWDSEGPVSYTHLTLPTILLV